MSRETQMTKLIDMLTRLRSKEPKKRIARELGKDVKTIRRFAQCALNKGWLDVSSPMPSEKDINDAFYAYKNSQPHMLEKYFEYIASCIEDQKNDDELTIEGIHRLLKNKIDAECELGGIAPEARPSFSESTFRRFVKKQFPRMRKSTVKRVLEQSIMEVDFGDIGTIFDDTAGVMRNRRAYIFVARLRYSRKMFVCVTLDQKSHSFAFAHTEAFEHFGGVPRECVPDNTKSAVVNAAFGETQLNQIYHDLAMHYGFKINPCRPYSPNDKGGVENGVKYVKRSCIALARRKERELGKTIPRLSVLKKEVSAWLHDVCDTHRIQGTQSSVNELFTEEQTSLCALPFEQWDPMTITTWSVGSNCRVHFDKCTYAVPDKCIGETLEIRAKTKRIQILFNHEVVVIHDRSSIPGRDVIGTVDLGHRHKAYVNATEEKALEIAEQIGPQTKVFIAMMFSKQVLSLLNESLAIVIGLRKKYGAHRVEAACARAVFYNSEARYRTIKSILEQNLDALSLSVPINEKREQLFRFMRTIELCVLITIFWRTL